MTAASGPSGRSAALSVVERLVTAVGSRDPSDPAPSHTPSEDVTAREQVRLIILLRWIAIAGQIATIAVASAGFGARLPLAMMAIVLGALLLLNAAGHLRLRSRVPIASVELLAALLFDVAALTAQLYFSGGATNPFTFLYLLQVTLAAVLLDTRSIWIVVAASGCCFTFLVVAYEPLRFDAPRDLFALHIQGMLLCFLLDAALLVVFVTRIMRTLRERDARLALLRQQASEEDHIVRMGLLASGAAHELGTPLATLSVILGDWRRMTTLQADPELMGEIVTMEAQVGRCKAIVTDILLSAGEARGMSAGITGLRAFLDDLVSDWKRARAAPHLAYRDEVGEDVTIVSDTALKQVIFNVLDNALEASPGWVEFVASRDADALVLAVGDKGGGFAPAMLERIGMPYRSSKQRPGRGIGLFLVVNAVRKLGGTVKARNPAAGGAVVTISLPLSAIGIAGEVRDER